MFNFAIDDWNWIIEHFQLRVKTHQRLTALYASQQIPQFASLAVGEAEESGNYSACEHALGPQIRLNRNADQRLYNLATLLLESQNPSQVGSVIAAAGLDYLKISVGSELACMLSPGTFWVANKKTAWAYLVDEFGGSTKSATEFLSSFQDAGLEKVYLLLQPSMLKLAGQKASTTLGKELETSQWRYLWADAISCRAHDLYH